MTFVTEGFSKKEKLYRTVEKDEEDKEEEDEGGEVDNEKWVRVLDSKGKSGK